MKSGRMPSAPNLNISPKSPHPEQNAPKTLTQRHSGAEKTGENSVPLCLCVKIFRLSQRVTFCQLVSRYLQHHKNKHLRFYLRDAQGCANAASARRAGAAHLR